MANGIINKKPIISGTITTGNSATGKIASGGGSTDHNRLLNREAENQHPIEAITDLREILDSKLDSETAFPLIEEAVQNKAKGLYFDAKKELAKKSYWYLTAEIDPKTKMGTKESIISGPYDLGAGGGGGGGGVTTVSIRPFNWPSTVVAGADATVSVTWSSTIGEDKEPTGEGTLYVSVNNKQVLVLPNKAQGVVEFNLGPYLTAGTNSVQVRVLDAYGTAGVLVRSTIAVTLELKSSFNDKLNFTDFINYNYIPYGDVEKTVYFIVDGVEKGTQLVKSTGEQQTYRITGLTHGSHTLEVYFTATINEEVVTSNKLFYDLIYYVEGNKTPIIVSTFNQLEQEQYIAFNIPYRVYIYGRNEFEVSFLVNDEEVNKTTVGTSEQYWNYINNTPGNYKLTIKCGQTTKDFNIYIKPSTINVTPVTQDLVLALSTQGRNNNEEAIVRSKWTDSVDNLECELTNFNWSSNGWVADTDGNTVLRLSGDARVTIPFEVFKEDFKNYGKTIELEMATSAVRNYSTTLISCLDKQSTDFYEVDETFVEEDFRRYIFKTNLDLNKIKDEDGNSKLTTGTHIFSYTANGWMLDSEILIDLADYGISISQYEINPEGTHTDEFVLIGDIISVNYTLAARGFYVTPQVAAFRSQQSTISTQYKEDEHVRVAFVIEKNSENRIIWMYINGIASGAMQYPVDDNFRQLEADYIYLGSNDAILDIYNIRVYNNSLTSKQIVNNWIADTQNATLKAERYTRNDNYNDKNEIVISKLPVGLPHIIWDIQPLPEFKGDKRLGNAIYKDPKDSSRNFTSEKAQYNVQGTSSSVYPVKNIRLKLKAKDGDPEFFWVDDNGDEIKKFPITYPDGIGDNYFTFKVDYASSEGANNVELVRLYNDASKAVGIFTPPQRVDSKVRVGIDGFPVAAFYRDEDGKDIFCTKANFNNDKANEDVYGFAEGDESWEVTNNSADETKFKVPATADNFENGFEIRFPDEDDWNRDTSKLTAMTTWVASTNTLEATGAELPEPITYTYTITTKGEDGTSSTKEETTTFTHDTADYRLIKFKAELPDWFNVNSTLFYYVYTLIYLMIDSRAKNAFPTYFKSRIAGDGGDRWFWIPYDMDTAIGIDNKGKLTFDYHLEDIDQLDGADVFNGQDSVMWNNVREAFAGELAAMYAEMRLSGLISYEETEKRFGEHQNQWSESIYNEDAKLKYIAPLANGDNYLEMLQGSKAQQRKWWLYNRFKYLDSKYNAGEAIKDFIQFRAYVDSGVEKPNLIITPYADIYATVSYANGRVVSKRAKRNEPIIIENPFSISEQENDQETYIYSASQLKSIGDISPFHPDTVKIGNAVKLQDLKVGDVSSDYSNPYLKELTVGSNTLLKTIDARNCVNLGTGVTSAPDLSQCINIEEIYFTGTKIKGIVLPDGGNIKKLHLPGTLTSLTIKNQPLLNDLNIEGSNTTLMVPVVNPDTFTIVGQVKEMTEWSDIELLSEIVLTDNETDINLILKDKNIYDILKLNKSSLVINCKQINVRYDLVDGENIELVNYTIADINTITENTDNLMLSIKPAIDYVLENVQAPTKDDYGISLIESLWLENIPSESIKSEAMVGKMKSNTAVRLIGINEDYATYEDIKRFYDILDTKKGLTFDGEITEKAQVTGTINIPELTYVQYVKCLERYPEIKINATKIICTVKFINEGEVFDTQNIASGACAIKPETPTKNATQQHYYIFNKWLYNNNEAWTPEDIITSDITLTADYIEKVQEYTAVFNPNSDIILVDPTSVTLFYGSKLPVPEESNIPKGVTLEGWYLPDGTVWDFENFLLVSDITLVARWKDKNAPSVNIFVKDATHFRYEASDNLGIIGWAVTVDSVEVPTEWHSITSTTYLTGEYEVTTAGVNTFWIKDSNNNIAQASLSVFTVSVTTTPGIESYTIYEENFEDNIITDVALISTKLKVRVAIDSHYQDLYLSAEDREITEDSIVVVQGPIMFDFRCTPKKYTVKFDLNNKGTTIDDQQITYLTYATKPVNQYWQPTSEVIEGWFRDPQYKTYWNFEVDQVLEDITLYAKWIEYHDPSEITIYIPEDAELNTNGKYEIEVDYTNGHNYTEETLVKVDFGDGELHSSSATPPIHLKYEYDTPGEKLIKIYGNNKGYSLGNNYEYQVVNPRQYVTKVKLAWDLSRITDYAFRGASITEAPLSEYISVIGIGAFAGCRQIKHLEIPKSILEIRDNAFEACESLEGTLVIPDNITKLGSYAFNRCNKLESVILNCSKISKLGDSTFASCSSLKTIEIPEFINNIGNNCFVACTTLEKIILRNKNLVGTYPFLDCYELKTAGPIGSVDSDGIPVNIEYAWDEFIPDYFFATGMNQSHLIEFIMHPDIISIGTNAFLNANITQISLPSGLETIGTSAFTYSKLRKVVVPDTVYELYPSAFSYCRSLSDVTLLNTSSEIKALEPTHGWFYQTNANLVIKVPSSIINEAEGLTPAQVYGDYWNVFSSSATNITYLDYRAIED